MNQSMIFHHPFPVHTNGTSGSQVRPQKMLEAFQKLGYEVESVTGYGSERRKKIQAVREQLQKGRKFAFLYSESHTLPTLLTEKHHFPTFPFLDFEFFKGLQKNNIPIGLFYRDIHWRFEQFKYLAWHKRSVTIPMYYYDWHQYQRLVNHLFLPSLAMKAFLPSVWPSDKLSALPPGAEEEPSNTTTHPGQLCFFYVGGVLPPLYDLKPLFTWLHDLQNVQLTLCCREKEWLEIQAYYQPLPKNVNIIHASGDDLKAFYARADLFVILWGSNPYLEFALPVKLFESIGHELPIIISAYGEAARFVASENIGWAVSSQKEFIDLVTSLQNHPERLEQKRQDVRAAKVRHTWQARAKQVAETLSSL